MFNCWCDPSSQALESQCKRLPHNAGMRARIELPRMPQAKSVYFFYAQNVLKRTKYDQRIYSDKLTTHFCTMEPRGLSSHSSTRKSSLESLVSPKIVSEPRLEPMIWYWEKICRMFVTWHVSLKCSEWGSKEPTQLPLLQPCCYFNKFVALLHRK